jgi:LysR family transcriptional regulator, hypochlorite-specific transcription factor HypT
MDMRWLEDVLVLLEEGNLTRAAKRRAITQPAFSRRIRSFETWLGQDILDRHTNRVEVRDSARQGEAEIRALVLRLRELRRQFRTSEATPQRVTFAAQHALTLSIFTDIVTLVKEAVEPVRYRLRTANRGDCISICLRGDADVLLCYEAEGDRSLPFDTSFERFVWGSDRLVPVVGGSLIYQLDGEGMLPKGAPVIAYPDSSYFGETLNRLFPDWLNSQRDYQTVCESAFSAGVREMVVQGIGMAWVPMSLVWRDIENATLRNLSRIHGSCELTISIYVRRDSFFSKRVLPKIMSLRMQGRSSRRKRG